MAVLTTKTRDALPESVFALPDRRYPIHDEAHARDALARVAANGTPEEQAKVRAAVHARYPDMGADKERTDAADRKRATNDKLNASINKAMGE